MSRQNDMYLMQMLTANVGEKNESAITNRLSAEIGYSASCSRLQVKYAGSLLSFYRSLQLIHLRELQFIRSIRPNALTAESQRP